LAVLSEPVWFWRRSSRADRVVGARGRSPSPQKVAREYQESVYRARREQEDERRRSLESAAAAALRRLEARGFPGAVKLADPKRKMRAAWYLCNTTANRPHGATGTSSYYLFSTGEVADVSGGHVTASRSPGEIVAALNRLGR
jgi:hypothetical protein